MFIKLDNFIKQLYELGLCKHKDMSEIPPALLLNMDEMASNVPENRKRVLCEEIMGRAMTVTAGGDRMPFHVTVALTSCAMGIFNDEPRGVFGGACPPTIIHAESGSKDKDPADVTDTYLDGIAELKDYQKIRDEYDNNPHGFQVLGT